VEGSGEAGNLTNRAKQTQHELKKHINRRLLELCH
jgi:hypothetical protein